MPTLTTDGGVELFYVEAGTYSQARACEDVHAVLDGLGIDRAHVVGVSMGGFAALHFGSRPPGPRPLPGDRRLRLWRRAVPAGAVRRRGRNLRRAVRGAWHGQGALAYALGPTRVQYQNKDPRSWQKFADQLTEHSTEGAACTMRGVQAWRLSPFDLVGQVAAIATPTLVMQDTGHALNLEDPAAFNAHLDSFFHSVDISAWRPRDRRAMAGDILGTK